jgi:dipeptidase D
MRDVQDAVVGAWIADETSIFIGSTPFPVPLNAWSRDFGGSILSLLRDLPHGFLAMSKAYPDIVETSSNLARVRTVQSGIQIGVGTRSLIEAQLDALLERICTRTERSNAVFETVDRYPSWQPNPDSPLLKLAEKVFRRLHDKAPTIHVVHGGLECGFIVSKLPEMDAISFWPLIKFAHTPQEYVTIPSVEVMWKMLVLLLEAVSEPYGLLT